MQNWEQAIQLLEESLAHQPDPAACRQLADTYAVRGRLKDTVATYLRLSQMLGEAGDFQAAMQTAQLALQLEPASIRARVHKVSLMERRGDPDLPQACIELSRLYLDQNQGDEAVKLLQRVCHRLPDHFELALELGETYLMLAQLQEARQQFSSWAQKSLQAGCLANACTALRRLKVMSPDDVGVLMELARIYQQRNFLQEAEQELRAVLRLNLSHLEALHRLGQVSLARGQSRDAILAFHRLLSIDPQHLEVREGLAQAYYAQGLGPEACKYWEEAAQLYLDRGQSQAAMGAFHQILRFDSQHPGALQGLLQLGASTTPFDLSFGQTDPDPNLPRECTEPVFLQSLPEPGWLQAMAAEEIPTWLTEGESADSFRLLSALEWSAFRAGFRAFDCSWSRTTFTVDGSFWALKNRCLELDLPQQFGEYRAYLKSRPQQAGAWRELACLMLRSGLTEESLDCLRAGLEHCPQADELGLAYLEAVIWNQDFVQALEWGLSLAERYQADGRVGEAQDLLQKLLGLDPTHLRARQMLIDLLTQPELKLLQLGQLAHQAERQGCWSVARQACEQLMTHGLNPMLWERIGFYCQQEGHDDQARAAYLQVLPYLESRRRYYDALTVCARLAQMRPDEVRYQLRRVELLQELGWEQAWKDQAVELAWRYYRGHCWGEALVWAERVLQRDGSDSRAWELGFGIHRDLQDGPRALEWAQGLRAANRGSGADEREILVEMLALVPSRCEWWKELAALCLQAGDLKAARLALERLAELQKPAQAVESWQQVVRLAPDDFEAHWKMAESCRLAGDARRLDCLRTCLALRPNHRAVGLALLRVLLDCQSFQEAAEVLRDRPELERECQATPWQWGQCYFHLGRWDEAIEQFQQARRSPELSAAALKMLGLCFASKPGKWMLNLALAQLQKALPLADLELRQELLYELGRLSHRVGDIQAALRYFYECARLGPDYRDLGDWLDRLELAPAM